VHIYAYSGFIKLIRDEIQFYKQTNNREDTTLATWWDAMKACLRGRIISYAPFKKKAANKNVITLEAKLKALESVHSHTKDRVTLNKIVKVKYKLNVLYNRKFRWSVNGFRYLGIQIPSDYTKMVRANMEPMFERIKMEFGRWSRVRLTIWGKISCIKMMTAPMIFYILSNIPLHIPDKYFKDLDFLIRQFLWGSSPHRLSIKKLQASAKPGGFSLPHFQWYYWVMNVKQLRAWLPTAPVKPIWSHIETENWWENIMEVIFSVLKRRFGISPKLSILGITTELSDGDFSSYTKRWIILALTTAKRVLLRHWRKKSPPPYEEWLKTRQGNG
uniref:Reverse transcriptase domain-containing protein n=1 Tax=Pundamilia nyererei TaxID=303518 RepID=A0A3B4EYQ9_9CICH